MSPKPGRNRPKARARARKRNSPPSAPIAMQAQTRQAQAAAAPAPLAARPIPMVARGGVAKTAPRLDYVKGDLKRIAVTASGIIVIIIALALVFR